MKYTQLQIQTIREAPSNARSEGQALLVRAAYQTREGSMLALGDSVIDRVRQIADDLIAKFGASPETMRGIFSAIKLDAIRSNEADKWYAIQSGGNADLILCPACGYASSAGLARSRKEPFDNAEPKPLEKVLTPDCPTIEALAEFLKIPQEKTAKALMFTRMSDSKFIFVVVRGDMQVSMMKLQQRVGEVRLASADEIVRAGAAAGYASPIRLTDALIVVDDLIPRSANLVAGANEHGYHLLNTNCPRDYEPTLIADLTQPRGNDPCPECGAMIEIRSAALIASAGAIYFDRLLLPLAEKFHDEKGLTLPSSIAPFDVYLMHVPGKEIDTLGEALNLYARLINSSARVLFDDRDERAGVKFNDADLIGCPLRITVGEKGLKNGMVELKARTAKENQTIAIHDVVDAVKSLLN